MNRFACAVMLFVALGESQAHRLDEYLQAVRLAIGNNQIGLSFELTPGVAVAAPFLPLLDVDRDGVISEVEQLAYLDLFLRQVRLSCDGKPVSMQITYSSFPSIEQMKTGDGIIQIKAAADIGRLTVGTHTVGLTNNHLPSISVYLVNALVPKDRTIEISAQERDLTQKNYLMRFTVRTENGEGRRHGP